MTFVLDSSVVLALISAESGSENYEPGAHDILISAVNLAEVISKLTERGSVPDAVLAMTSQIDMRVMEMTESQAIGCGFLRAQTRKFGLSLGDRACLALAIEHKARVLTMDRAWVNLDLGVGIDILR